MSRLSPAAGAGSSPAFALLMMLTATLTACSIDYESGRLASELAEQTPDTILYDLEQRVVRDGYERFVVTAARAETFSRTKRRFLYEISFVEYEESGEIVTTGTADYAEFETDTENFTISGSLEFFSAEEDAWLTANELFWDADQRALISPEQELVSIDQTNGTFVQGRGFRADMARNQLEFTRGVSGQIPLEDDEDE